MGSRSADRSWEAERLVDRNPRILTSDTATNMVCNMAYYRTTDLDGDKLHLRTFGAGHGTISRTEEVATSLTNGQETGTRTQTYTQKGWDNSFAFAHGNLSDTAGHTGTWNSNALTGDSINDKVTITSSLASGTWTESGRTFTVDQKKAGNTSYHQEDGRGLSDASVTEK